MKIVLVHLTQLAGVAWAIQPLTGDAVKRNEFMDIDDALHRKLRRCPDDFVCPQFSTRKLGRSCYDSFADCQCDPGFDRTADGCVAKEGLCTIEYADMIERKQNDVEFWVDKAYGTVEEEEQYRYLQEMNSVLEDAWKDYTRGIASCQQEDFANEIDGDRRRLFIGNFFRKIAEGFKKVVEAVVNVVVEVVELVVDVVVEVVECGVGIVTGGLKCGLVGCAFGLIGVALDIAFTLATGGVNKVSALACGLSEGDNEEEESCQTQQCQNDRKRKKRNSVLAKILEGVGSSVCAINERIQSPLLNQVCSFSKQLSDSNDESAVVDLFVNNKPVLRFLEALKGAICGNPGSAILDLLEEVVNCLIGCADGGNAFCKAIEQESNNDQEKEPSVDQPPAIEYQKITGEACRTGDGGTGAKDKEYSLFKDTSSGDCEQKCSDSAQCMGWEYSPKNGRCELWNEEPKRFEEKAGFDCYVKLDSNKN